MLPIPARGDKRVPLIGTMRAAHVWRARRVQSV